MCVRCDGRPVLRALLLFGSRESAHVYPDVVQPVLTSTSTITSFNHFLPKQKHVEFACFFSTFIFYYTYDTT